MWKIDHKKKKQICARVRQIRIERFGDGRGAQKEMSRALDLAYTTYRGYEENRVNDDFLRTFAKKFNVPFMWLMAAEAETGPPPTPSPSIITIDPDRGVVNSGKYRVVVVEDDAMAPTVKRGAWVGVAPIDLNIEPQNKLVAIKLSIKKDRIVIRRILVRGRTVTALADNPHTLYEPIYIHKSDVVGEAVWQFSSLKT